MAKMSGAKSDMKVYGMAGAMLIVLCGLAFAGRATIAERKDIPGIPSISPQEAEAIRATVIKAEPSDFRLDTRKLSNIGVDEGAEILAIYTAKSLPSKCGDFRNLAPRYRTPSKYERRFDFSENPEILTAMKGYKCIVIRNAMADKSAPVYGPASREDQELMEYNGPFLPEDEMSGEEADS